MSPTKLVFLVAFTGEQAYSGPWLLSAGVEEEVMYSKGHLMQCRTFSSPILHLHQLHPLFLSGPLKAFLY